MIIGADNGIGIHAADLPENVVVMQVGVGISARIGTGARVGYIMPRGPRGLVKVHVVLADYVLPPVVDVIELEVRPTPAPAMAVAVLARMVVAVAILVVTRTVVVPVTEALRALAGRVVRFAVSFEGRFSIASYLIILAFSTYTIHRLAEIVIR